MMPPRARYGAKLRKHPRLSILGGCLRRWPGEVAGGIEGSAAKRNPNKYLCLILAGVVFGALALGVSSCGSQTSKTYKPPAVADLSGMPWSKAFEKLNEKIEREYAFTQWKGIDWEAL